MKGTVAIKNGNTITSGVHYLLVQLVLSDYVRSCCDGFPAQLLSQTWTVGSYCSHSNGLKLCPKKHGHLLSLEKEHLQFRNFRKHLPVQI